MPDQDQHSLRRMYSFAESIKQGGALPNKPPGTDKRWTGQGDVLSTSRKGKCSLVGKPGWEYKKTKKCRDGKPGDYRVKKNAM